MEAEYARERRRRRTVVILGIILAILAAAAVYYVVSQRPAGTGEAPQKTIVVAAIDIAAETEIELQMIRSETVTDSAALTLAATSAEQVVGQRALVRITAGSPILAGMYGAATAAGLAVIPQGEELTPDSPDYRAVSVEIPDDRAVG